MSARFKGNSQSGYTLVELLVVMMILASLSTLAAPRFQSMLPSVKAQAHVSALELTLTRARLLSLETGRVVQVAINPNGDFETKYLGGDIILERAGPRNLNVSIMGKTQTEFTIQFLPSGGVVGDDFKVINRGRVLSFKKSVSGAGYRRVRSAAG